MGFYVLFVLKTENGTQSMVSAKVMVFLRIYLVLLDISYLFFVFIDDFRFWSVCFSLFIDFELIPESIELFLIWSCNIELFCDDGYSLIGNIGIMNEPIEAIGGSHFDIIAHNLSESFIVCYDEEVDHDYVAQFELVDHLGHVHVAESVQKHYCCLGM